VLQCVSNKADTNFQEVLGGHPATRAIWLTSGRMQRPIAGGLLIGVAICAMHYAGMAALDLPAVGN
jgi:NO-binding membrane sensor protein with MHYT domain